MARYGVIHENLLFEMMASSYCIVFRGVHKCKTVTALNINHGLYFSNPGSYKPGLVHCSKTQTKPHQHRVSDQVYTDQVSAWFNGGLNHGLDHCSKIGPSVWRYCQFVTSGYFVSSVLNPSIDKVMFWSWNMAISEKILELSKDRSNVYHINNVHSPYDIGVDTICTYT